MNDGINRRLELLRHHWRAGGYKTDAPRGGSIGGTSSITGYASSLLVVPLVRNGRGRSISVEVIGGTSLAQHYVEVVTG